MAMDTFRRPEAFEPVFEVRSDSENGRTHVRLHGEFDIAAVPLLEQECRRIEEWGSRVVYLDLEGLTFIDAAGLEAILSAQARARKDGRKVFELTGNRAALISICPPPVLLNGDHRG